MSKKNNAPRYKTTRYLTAEERPLFAPYHSVHETAKDKANKRSAQKLAMKRELERY